MANAVKNIDSQLQTYLTCLSEKNKIIVLNVAQALAQDVEQGSDFELSAKEIALLDKRWDAYKKGTTKVYSWEEVNKELKKKLKAAKH
jgi:putative addiction module component (TIGR02574 family)